MSDWVDVRNFDDLMSGYQKSSRDNTHMPGIGDYFKQLIVQNQRIIELLDSIDDLLRLQS